MEQIKRCIIILTFFFFSCENEPVDFVPANNNQIVLDTLKNYSDYILGDFNGKFLVSTNVFTKSYSASTNSIPIDSSYIQFQIGYKLIKNNIEKSTFVGFRFLESKTKLDTQNHYTYKHFSDFVDFFDRNKFDYFQMNQPVNNIHTIVIGFQNHYEIDNDINRYVTNNYTEEITNEKFNFTIDSIKVIESSLKKVEVYYSFYCVGVNEYFDELKIKNGKGKSTFEYNP